MATFLDLSFLQGLTPVFIFFLIFAAAYAIISSFKLLGGSKPIAAIIAFVIGIFVALSSKTITFILAIIPWFTMLAAILIFAIIIFKTFGISDESIISAGKHNTLMWTIIIISLVILVGGLSAVFGQSQLEYTDDTASTVDDSSNTRDVARSDDRVREYNIDELSDDEALARDTEALSDSIAIGRTDSTDTDSGDFGENVASTLYHPRVLGFILIMLIAVMTIVQLTKLPKP